MGVQDNAAAERLVRGTDNIMVAIDNRQRGIEDKLHPGGFARQSLFVFQQTYARNDLVRAGVQGDFGVVC